MHFQAGDNAVMVVVSLLLCAKREYVYLAVLSPIMIIGRERESNNTFLYFRVFLKNFWSPPSPPGLDSVK